MIRLVIVDDDRGILESVREAFVAETDLCLVGLHDSASEAIRETDWLGVDVLVTDLDMPEMSGVALIVAARALQPSLLALAYTVHEQRETLHAALRAGACGYVLKATGAQGLGDAVRACARGESPLSPSVARHLIREFQGFPDGSASNSLSAREGEVLRCLAEGLMYKEVASHLQLSPHTIHAHVKKIYGKLHAHSREEAVRMARIRGYMP